MQWLRQSTQRKVVIDGVVAVGDGFTPVTSLTLTGADEAELMKHDAAATVDISGRTFAAIASNDGAYNLTLTTTDTNTLGMASIEINDDSLILPVKKEFMVVPAQVWDSLFGSDVLQVDLIQIIGNASRVTEWAKALDTIKGFTVDDTAFTPTSIELETSGITEATTDHFKGRLLAFYDSGDALFRQFTKISAYTLTGGRGHFTYAALAPGDAPVNGDLAVIL